MVPFLLNLVCEVQRGMRAEVCPARVLLSNKSLQNNGTFCCAASDATRPLLTKSLRLAVQAHDAHMSHIRADSKAGCFLQKHGGPPTLSTLGDATMTLPQLQRTKGCGGRVTPVQATLSRDKHVLPCLQA